MDEFDSIDKLKYFKLNPMMLQNSSIRRNDKNFNENKIETLIKLDK